MSYYAVLGVSTTIIVIMAALIWSKTKSPSFLLGLAFLYYWSLFGGWTIVTDRLSNEAGHRKYGYLEEKLFPVHLDDNYFWTLVYYAMFIITIETVLLLMLWAVRTDGQPRPAPVRISHLMILAIASVAGAASYLLVRGDLETAQSLNVSAYALVRNHGQLSELYTIHQMLNRVGLLTAALGCAIFCSGKSPRFLVGEGFLAPAFGYLSVLGGMFGFAVLLGSKNELVFAGVGAVLLYLSNCRTPRTGMLAVLGVLGVCGLWVIDLLRGFPLEQLVETLNKLEPEEWSESVMFVTSSNEGFAGHFSLYGALAYNVPITAGSSLASLAASFVPRLLWTDRPEEIYDHYSTFVGATHGQGYTVHHATGWYLNFGVPGIVLGGIVMGGIWALCFRASARIRTGQSRWYRIWAAVIPCMFVANMPMLIRTGFEGYKAVLFEAFILPTVTLGLASINWKGLVRAAASSHRSTKETTTHGQGQAIGKIA